ncbi:hypothetical protein F0562_022934 [Nyssa sinensis]|uniref:Uncharacterized protein n=1 Tax=Nyssa sinensis TaxID=561372 RepID=A0A5J5BJ49_9ASTE|nr:hypothetical protein F0562_022934 [Nyssa sinensis]
MDIIVDSLRQAFMPKRDYDKLREEEKSWTRLQWPLLTATISLLSLTVIVSVTVSLAIVFPANGSNRPFARPASDYYLMVVLVPSSIIFLSSVTYLFAGITVAYSAPARHGCLKVVENNCCASKRGGGQCLSILNLIFAAIFGLLALFLSSSLLLLGSSCSLPLFWCYEIAS